MRKLKLDVEALEVQSFATESRSGDRGTVLGRSGWPSCFTYPVCATGASYCRCLPSIDVCNSPDCPSNAGCGTDWDTCARSCQTCEGQETCPPEP